MKSSNLQTGNKGEDIASKYLQEKGFKIIDRKWKKDFGELDIVATKNKITYFIEVKTQFENQQTSPVDELTQSKISKLKNLVSGYSMYHPDIPQKFMLSAICIWLDYDKNPTKIQWIENLME